MSDKKAHVRLFGALEIKLPNGNTQRIRRGFVAEFEDTAAMERSLNSGFAPLDFGDDDTVAVVLVNQPKKDPT